jgi:hypothetical protein
MQLSHWSLLLGALLAAKGLFALLATPAAQRVAQRFARAVWTGRVLATIAWIWAGWALYTMPLEILAPVRALIPWLTLAAIPLSWFWMADLLGCRAVGGLLTLFPCPLLLVARFHPSPWRLVLVTFAYACIVAGMFLILYPYYLRRALAFFAARPLCMRLAGAAALALGACFAALGLAALR